MKPAPLVLIVGFLGAGKTTLLRDLLPLLEASELDPFVIINDYANARVDASSLIKEGRTVKPINGNCICCDSASELIDMLLEIPPSEKRIVLIEANGTTDPTALIEHLLVNPDLRQRFVPLLQVTVVDLQRWQKRHRHNDLERLQVETASHLFLTRQSTTSKKRIATVRADIECFNTKALEIHLESFADELQQIAIQSRACAAPHASSSHNPQRHGDHEHHDEHGHENEHSHHGHSHEDSRHQLSHAFVGLEIDLPDPMEAAHLQRWLISLPPDVLRVKGVVRLVEYPDRWFQFQRVDELRGEAALYQLPQKPIVPACAVLIGVQLDEPLIRQRLKESATDTACLPT
jgi:G3E family GTPase